MMNIALSTEAIDGSYSGSAKSLENHHALEYGDKAALSTYRFELFIADKDTRYGPACAAVAEEAVVAESEARMAKVLADFDEAFGHNTEHTLSTTHQGDNLSTIANAGSSTGLHELPSRGTYKETLDLQRVKDFMKDTVLTYLPESGGTTESVARQRMAAGLEIILKALEGNK